ncbi:Hypothetical predicted protein [Lynx pardinus]|uniref:Uncharacterized protein n=1 Tax=Lynx pardinus TaxID=191816 RepID=A0A485NS22_LYNPA|nr:Hypothetical predicted protein [Lynx pardinus]
MAESQQALKNACGQERIMAMDWERQKAELRTVDLQAKSATPAFQTDCHPSAGPSLAQHCLHSEPDGSPILLPSSPSLPISSSGYRKTTENHSAGSALSLVTPSSSDTSMLPYLAT